MTNRSIELLNKIQTELIAFANRQGINLANEFKTVDDFKQFVIALTYKMLIDLGVEPKEAFDMTLGDGAYDRLVEITWNHANGIQA